LAIRLILRCQLAWDWNASVIAIVIDVKQNMTYIPLISNFRIALILLASLCTSSLAFGQSKDQLKKEGTLAYLKLSNGTKDFKLGSDIAASQLKNLIYLEGNDGTPDADSCVTYEYNAGNQLKLDKDLNLEHICLRLYKNKIVNIYVFFKQKEGYSLLRNFLKNYGMFTARPDNYLDNYRWDSSEVTLSLNYTRNNDLGVAVFTSVNLNNEIKQERAKVLAQQLQAPSLLSSN
jgi:hypothetical protein